MYSSSIGNFWIQIYADNRPQFERFFRQRVNSPEDCEDLQQELYIRVHKLDPDKPIDDPRAYLFRIALNLVNDLLRRRQRLSYQSAEIPDEAEVRDDTYSAEVQLYDRQRVRLLEQAIAELPPKCRQVFLLRKVEDLSAREIAARLDISQNMVEKHLRKALSDCRAYLAKKAGEAN